MIGQLTLLLLVEGGGESIGNSEKLDLFCSCIQLYVLLCPHKKLRGMVRKYHNDTRQNNPRHREEEPQNINSHKTSGRQLKQNTLLYLPR